MLRFELLKAESLAWRLRFALDHCVVETTLFMPVGTCGFDKVMMPQSP